MAAYAVSDNGLRHQRFLAYFFLIPMFFSPGIIPYYLTIFKVGIMNTFWALVLPGMVLPMWFFVARACFKSFPMEILEAARIDGAGHFQTFWRVVVPCNKPIISTLFMMYGVSHWNEYFMTRLVVQRNLWTAPVQLYNMMAEQQLMLGLGLGVRINLQSYLSAVTACLIIPVFVIYPFLQRFIISGLTSGSVKG